MTRTTSDPVVAEDSEYSAVAFDEPGDGIVLVDAQDMCNHDATIRTDSLVEVER